MIATAEPRLVAPPAEPRSEPLDLVDVAFLAGAVIAPMELHIFGSFTVYDMLVAGLWFLLAAGPRRLRPLPTAFVGPALVFLVAALVSSFRATYPVEALTQLAQFAFIFFVQIPVALTVVRTRRIVRWSVALFVVGSLAAVVVSILTGHATGADRALLFNSDNPNPLGYPGAYILPFALWLALERWRSGRRLTALLAGGLMIALVAWSLAASASRGATVAALVSLPLFLVLRRARRLGPGTVARLVATVAIVVAAGFALYSTSYFPSVLKDRIARTLANESSLIEDRERLAVAGMRAFRASPFVGTGLDNFRYVAARYHASATPQAPHNMWIQFLAQVGIVGTIAFAVVVGRWYLIVLRAWGGSSDRSRHELLAAFLAAVTAILTIYLTTPIMVDRHYWLLVALGLALALPAPDLDGASGMERAP